MEKPIGISDPRERFDFKWQKRHIIVDHFHKQILIQVLWDNGGNLRYDEFKRMEGGNYGDYLPKGLDRVSVEIRREIGNLIGSGYSVKPMFFHGQENEEHAVILLTDIREPKLTKIEV